MKRIISMTLLVLVLMTSFALAEDTSMSYIMDKGTFILGLDDSLPPMGYRNEENEIVGFDIDVAKEFCKRLGVELILQPIDWGAKELELSSKNIDCIWNGMSITPQRQESMSMTFSYLNNQILVYTRKSDAVKSAADLAGKIVAVQGGSFAEDILNSDENKAMTESFGEVLPFEDYLTALMDLQQGGVDAVAIDLVVANFHLASIGDDALESTIALSDDNYGVGFRKEDVALCQKTEEILMDMKADGTLAAISTTWFGSDITVVPTK